MLLFIIIYFFLQKLKLDHQAGITGKLDTIQHWNHMLFLWIFIVIMTQNHFFTKRFRSNQKW